ncbi:MAG: exo-alpha-sialidase [Opitutae bacterium]|nr:exo-alpha-sialidase [Opitutae bacterium]
MINKSPNSSFRRAHWPQRSLASFAPTLARLASCAFALGALTLGQTASAAQTYSRTNKFFNGTGVAGTSTTYHSYRIPALLTGYQNTLFVFCEAHLNSASDWGTPIDLVYKRSTNNGGSWEPMKVLAGAANTPAGSRGWTNPTAVYEPTWSGGPTMGRIHLFFNWHSESETGLDTLVYGDTRVYYMYSDDNGANWSARVNLTSTLNPSSLGLAYDNVGPGIGIRKAQTQAGLLIVPALSRNFYSLDHGAHWYYRRVPAGTSGHITNEGAIVECLDGTLLRNDRPKGDTWDIAKTRWISYGELIANSDGTATGDFANYVSQAVLLDPKCQGSILRYNFNSPDRVIFLNSDNTTDRCRMKVRISYDDGLTWPRARWLYEGTPPDNYPSVSNAQDAGMGGYSSMIKHPSIGIVAGVEICEGGKDNYNNVAYARSIDLHMFNIEWINKGQSEAGF